MALHLLCGRWWSIVCPHFGALPSIQKGWISRAVCSLLPELTHPLWYTRLHVLHLVTQVPKVLPDLCSQSWGINLVALCILLRVQQLNVHLSYKTPSSWRILFWSGGHPRQFSHLKRCMDIVFPRRGCLKGIILQGRQIRPGFTYGIPIIHKKKRGHSGILCPCTQT